MEEIKKDSTLKNKWNILRKAILSKSNDLIKDISFPENGSLFPSSIHCIPYYPRIYYKINNKRYNIPLHLQRITDRIEKYNNINDNNKNMYELCIIALGTYIPLAIEIIMKLKDFNIRCIHTKLIQGKKSMIQIIVGLNNNNNNIDLERKEFILSKYECITIIERLENRKLALKELCSHHHSNKIDNTGNIRTWPSARIFLYYLLNNKTFCQLLKKTIQILELGAGMTGLIGFGIAALIKRYNNHKSMITITDGNENAIEILQINLKENIHAGNILKDNVQVKQLIWGNNVYNNNQNSYQKYDIILVCDCLFFEDYHDHLIKTIYVCLNHGKDKYCLLLQPKRGLSLENFIKKAKTKFIVHRISNYNDDILVLYEEFKLKYPLLLLKQEEMVPTLLKLQHID